MLAFLSALCRVSRVKSGLLVRELWGLATSFMSVEVGAEETERTDEDGEEDPAEISLEGDMACGERTRS